MLPSDEVVSRILEVLYEAPLDPSRWQQFLQLTARAAAGHASAIFSIDTGNVLSSIRAQWGFDPDATRQYEKKYGAGGGPWFQAVSCSADWIGPSQHFVPFRDLQRTSFYKEIVEPYEIPHALLAMIERSPSRIVSLSIYRSWQAGSFEERNLDIMRFLRPHIQRAYRLHTEFSKAQSRTNGLLAALDALSSGVILLDPRMQVVAMNRVAERVMAAHDGLLTKQNIVSAEHAAESARLQELIAKAVNTGNGSGLDSAGALTISRRDLPPLQVLISPVRGCDLDQNRPVRAIMFVKDPNQRIRPKNETLHALFGLTAAECRLALLLADGHAPKQIAEMVGVGRNTLKSQLASIFRKTGTSRQSQLVRLLSHLLPSL